MNRRSIKRIMIIIAVVCLTTCTVMATSPSNEIEKNFTKMYDNMKNIQKQLSSIVEVVYKNKLEGQSSDSSEKILKYINTELNRMISDLEQMDSSKLNSVQSAKLQVLIASANILKYMDNALIDYIHAEGGVEQLQLLKAYFKLDAIINQFIIDYEYFGSNPSITINK